MGTPAETPRQLVFVSPIGGRGDPTLQAARSLARACEAELVVSRSPHDALARSGAGTVLVVKPRARSASGRARDDELDRSFCADLPSPALLYAGDPAARASVVAAVALRDDTPTDADRAVVLWAALLARWRGERLHVVHAWAPIGDSIISCPVRGLGARGAARRLVRARREQTDRMDALLESCGVGADVPRVIGRGVPSKVIRIVAARARADLLVVGHRGRTGLARLPGQPADAAWDKPCMSLLAIDARSARPDLVPFPSTSTP